MDACRSTQNRQQENPAAFPTAVATRRRWRELAARGLIASLFLGAAALWIVMVT
ncbi:hypothetical protein [Aquibaculum sediminis]|uniref:hypothetical protein n=1 Tax=Aquibaculum sediminis TaxID=3231907 RepID=UPI0034533839